MPCLAGRSILISKSLISDSILVGNAIRSNRGVNCLQGTNVSPLASRAEDVDAAVGLGPSSGAIQSVKHAARPTISSELKPNEDLSSMFTRHAEFSKSTKQRAA